MKSWWEYFAIALKNWWVGGIMVVDLFIFTFFRLIQIVGNHFTNYVPLGLLSYHD